MKEADVRIGETYWAKVRGVVVPVKVDRKSPLGGWVGMNTLTGRTVRIKSAQRLRGVVNLRSEV